MRAAGPYTVRPIRSRYVVDGPGSDGIPPATKGQAEAIANLMNVAYEEGLMPRVDVDAGKAFNVAARHAMRAKQLVAELVAALKQTHRALIDIRDSRGEPTYASQRRAMEELERIIDVAAAAIEKAGGR